VRALRAVGGNLATARIAGAEPKATAPGPPAPTRAPARVEGADPDGAV